MQFDFLPSVWQNVWLAFKYVFILSPIWLPLALGYAFLNAWINYRRRKFWSTQTMMLLEVKFPREVSKGPAAMEVILGAFHQGGGEGTWVDRIWYGKTRPWFSLELVSDGGKIHFYIWTRAALRNVIEAQIYAQFPEVEIFEVPDYTIPYYYDPARNNIAGGELALTKPDPYPIKTYVDYALEGDPTDTTKVDPMTPLLETLGAITEGHQIWIQILIRAHKKTRIWDVFGEKEDAWQDQAKKEKDTIIAKYKGEGDKAVSRMPTKGETDMIAALERSVTKLPFDCGIRFVYIADKDKFSSAFSGSVNGAWKQYGSANLNGFKPSGWFGIFEYPWQDYFGRKKEWMKKALLEEFKLRSFFYSTHKGKNFYSKPFVLNTEELATIFHFPGPVAATPTLERLPSRKVEAPSNLPM